MFHDIPKTLLERMRILEKIDARDRQDGTPHIKRMRQITRETGMFLALIAANAPKGIFLELGTSAGYSTMWVALACRQHGNKLITIEILQEKVELAKETIQQAGIEDIVELVTGDARDIIRDYKGIAFCFLDADKNTYIDCYEAIVPNMVQGGLLVADNLISHQEILRPFHDRCFNDERVDCMIVPVGRGELLCRKI
jgi:predicted O-methyltransferase YrrM